MTRESHFSAEESSTRQRILDAAMQLFSERGYGATPIKAIAHACGISDAGIFHHFRNKQAILQALWDRPNTRVLQDVAGDVVSDYDTLRRLILQNLDAAAENARLHRLLIRQQLDGDKHAAAARALAMSGWRDSLRKWFILYDAASATLMVDSLVHSLLGVVFLAEVEHGSAFVEVVSSQEFRAEAVRVVSRAVALDRFQPAARLSPSAEVEASS